LNRSISTIEDGISGRLQHCHKTCCEKDGRCGRRACMVQRWHHRRDIVFQTGGLVYDNYTNLAYFKKTYVLHVIDI